MKALKILSIIALSLLSNLVVGQDTIYVYQKVGGILKIPTNNVDSIIFYDTTSIAVDTTISTTSQVRLENGETPLDIYQSGVPIDSIIGKTYQGGLIAYLDTLDGTGLIAAPHDQSRLRWGCSETTILGAVGIAIGTGKQNTADIIAGCSSTNTASYYCDTLTIGRYKDWFLPSKDELNKLYENIGQGNALGLGNVGGFASYFYWSSTEIDNFIAWLQYFANGNQGYNYKGNYSHLSVRAVRAF